MTSQFTVFVWNDEELVIRYTSSDAESLKVADDLRTELHKDNDDPRWQWSAGHLSVTVRGPVK